MTTTSIVNNNNNNEGAKYGGTTVSTQHTMGATYCFNVEYGASPPVTTIVNIFDDIMKYGDIARMSALTINNNNVKYDGTMMYVASVTSIFYVLFFDLRDSVSMICACFMF